MDESVSLTPVDHDPFADTTAEFAPFTPPQQPTIAQASPPPPPQTEGPSLPPGSSFGTLAPADYSWTQRIGNAAQDVMSYLGAPLGYSQDFGQKIQGIAQNTPIVGNVLQGNDAVRDYQGGNYVNSAIDAAGSLAMFAGPMSKMADHGALAIAKDLATQGVDRDAIWRKTGWGQHPSGDWFYEIPDNKATVTPRMSENIPQVAGADPNSGAPVYQDYFGSMKNFLDHPDLYQAYPRAAIIQTRVTYDPTRMANAYFDRNLNNYEIGMNPNRISPLPNDSGLPKHLDQNFDPANPQTIDQDYGSIPELAGHELQHYVNRIEGWPQGTNPGEVGSYAEYWNNPGEIQARNTSYRLQMTPEERRAIPPWYTEDQVTSQSPTSSNNLPVRQSSEPPPGHTLTPVDHDPFNEEEGERYTGNDLPTERSSSPEPIHDKTLQDRLDEAGMSHEDFLDSMFGKYSRDANKEIAGGISNDGEQVVSHLYHPDYPDSPLGYTYREFPKGTDDAIHGSLEIDPSFQGEGIGKYLLQRHIDTYNKLGINNVKLTANIDIGGYAWAKYGFVPNKWGWSSVASKARGRAQNLLKSGEIDKDTYDSVKQLTLSDDPRSIHDLSDLSQRVNTDEDGETTLGKALLLGQSWDGQLNLKDPDSMARFNAYIKKGSNNPP